MPLCDAIFEDADKFMIEFKQIKVWQNLTIYFTPNKQQQYKQILERMDLSNLRELACKNFYKDITDDVIAQILQPSLEKIYFEVNSKHVYFNLLYYAFETLLNAFHLE
uniref:Uncharacterized protein n=1 Tax=Panagrolaimus davidi TaxID=227884 RepID=A0A914QCD8_9BILA